jgi:hypothetical protein
MQLRVMFLAPSITSPWNFIDIDLSDTYWGAFTYCCDMRKRQIRDGDGLTLGHRWQPMKHSFSALLIPRKEGKRSPDIGRPRSFDELALLGSYQP